MYTSPSNPFAPQGFNGTCQFPQITRGGLDDSWQHGRDLFNVYKDRFGSLLVNPSHQVSYRVTNNVITSQVAGMAMAAMYGSAKELPLAIQPASIDSLEPKYTCDAGAALYNSYGVGSTNPNWTAHMTASQPLFEVLDSISGVLPDNPGFHQSWDHYFDNLSSRLCHGKALPCKVCTNPILKHGTYLLTPNRPPIQHPASPPPPPTPSSASAFTSTPISTAPLLKASSPAPPATASTSQN